MSMRRLLLFRLADGFRKTMRERIGNQRKETVKNFIPVDILLSFLGDNLGC